MIVLITSSTPNHCRNSPAIPAHAAPAHAAPERVVSLNLCADQLLVLLAPERVAALSTLSRDPALSHVAPQAAALSQVRADAEAVLRLRPDLLRFAPDVAARFGIYPSDAAELFAEEQALEQGVSAEHEPDVDEGGLVAAPEEELA